MQVTIEIPDDLAREIRLMGNHQAKEYNSTHTQKRENMLKLQTMGIVDIHVDSQRQNIFFFKAYLTGHGRRIKELIMEKEDAN